MKGLAIYAVVITVVAVGAIGVAVGFLVARATEDDKEAVQATAEATQAPQPQATEYVPQLTGVEAAAKAKALLFKGLDFSVAENVRAFAESSCTAEDFNARDLAWIVTCNVRGLEINYRVFDATGKVEQVN